MSGHSKWHNIQARKSVTDAHKGKLYSKHGKLIEVAARSGGDPGTNATLRSAIERAKFDGVPNANIDRAVKKGTGELKDGSEIVEVMYEGFGPGGTAMYVQVLTDNKNRSYQSVKNILSKHGGAIGEAGVVGWMFDKRGMIEVDVGGGAKGVGGVNSGVSLDDLELMAIDAGASDVQREEGALTVYTDPSSLHEVKKKLESQDVAVKKSEITFVPKNLVSIGDVDMAKKIFTLLEIFDEDDDVTQVFSNYDIPDEIMEGL